MQHNFQFKSSIEFNTSRYKQKEEQLLSKSYVKKRGSQQIDEINNSVNNNDKEKDNIRERIEKNEFIEKSAEELFPSKKSFSYRKAELQRIIPQVSSKCWAIFDANKMTFLHGKREYFKRECASLTKIMTCYVCINLCRLWKLSIKKTDITVSAIASDIRGTSANLETGDILTVEQLLYGLMLPSGNDAAFALA